MILSHIVAVSRNRVIGREGDLPWRHSADLKYFKATTQGHAVIMGRKTFASLGRPLPNRLNIVISRDPDFRAAGAAVCHSVAEATALAGSASATWGQEAFIIGGGEIYQLTMGQVDRIYLTLMDTEVDGDTFYPDIPVGDFSVREVGRDSGPPACTWFVYERIRKAHAAT